MSKGYVYVLINPAMPGLVKIGRTTGDPYARAAQLQSTGVPMPFKVEFSVFSPNCIELEANVHSMFPDKRVSGQREFFTCAVQEAIWQIELALENQVQSFVDEFMPDHVITRSELLLDPGDLSYLCSQLGEPEAVAVAAISMISADELRPYVMRYYDKIAKRKTGMIK